LHEFEIGDNVRVRGLVSAAGRGLNGCVGFIVRPDTLARRYGVKFENQDEVKAIRAENLGLTVLPSALQTATNSELLLLNFDKNASRGRQSFEEPLVGDRVQIHGLTSELGLLLNDRIGSIISFDPCTCRYGVNVRGEDKPKSILAENLLLRAMKSSFTPSTTKAAPAHLIAPNLEDILGQPVMEHSLSDTHDQCPETMQGVSSVNAQLSAALMQSRIPHSEGHYVVLLTFSRSPHSFREACLQSAGAIGDCRHAMEDAGLQMELACGTKMLVHPWQYEPALTALQQSNVKLLRQHVVADPHLADAIVALVKGLPRREKVYPRGARTLPIGAAVAISQMNLQVSVASTFISIHVPSSLMSSRSLGPRTVSTTDADARKGSNPRSGKYTGQE